MSSQKKILIVDDVPEITTLIQQFVKKLGHASKIATSGRVAKDLYRSYLPDILILDVIMPDIDGVEFLRWLGQEYPNRSAILIISGFPGEYVTSVHKLSEPLNAGISRFLPKPMSFAAFEAALNDLIAAGEATANDPDAPQP